MSRYTLSNKTLDFVSHLTFYDQTVEAGLKPSVLHCIIRVSCIKTSPYVRVNEQQSRLNYRLVLSCRGTKKSHVLGALECHSKSARIVPLLTLNTQGKTSIL